MKSCFCRWRQHPHGKKVLHGYGIVWLKGAGWALPTHGKNEEQAQNWLEPTTACGSLAFLPEEILTRGDRASGRLI